MRPTKQFLYPSEFLALDVTIKDRRLYAIARYTWLRANELEALGWDVIDLEHDIIHVHRAVDRTTGVEHEVKGGRGARRIPMHPDVKPIFKAMRDEGWLRPCLQSRGTSWRPSVLGRKLPPLR